MIPDMIHTPYIAPRISVMAPPPVTAERFVDELLSGLCMLCCPSRSQRRSFLQRLECGNEAPSQSAYFSLFADARQCDLPQPGYHRVLG